MLGVDCGRIEVEAGPVPALGLVTAYIDPWCWRVPGAIAVCGGTITLVSESRYVFSWLISGPVQPS